MKTAVIVPAYNEAGRITRVLDAIAMATLVDEILVITDGCTDTTEEEAHGFAALVREGGSFGKCEGGTPGGDESGASSGSATGEPFRCRQVRVLTLEQNLGKGGAMVHGAHHTDAPILVFLDADLIGLQPAQVDDMLRPMLAEDPAQRADMCLGLFGAIRGGLAGWWLSFCHRRVAAITGQRAIRRDVFLAIPNLTQSRFGVETTITRYVKHLWRLRVTETYLHGVTHPIKEEKIGILRGVSYRLAMYAEILMCLLVDIVRQKTSTEARRQVESMRSRFGHGSPSRG